MNVIRGEEQRKTSHSKAIMEATRRVLLHLRRPEPVEIEPPVALPLAALREEKLLPFPVVRRLRHFFTPIPSKLI
jgi:hypothetical protein